MKKSAIEEMYYNGRGCGDLIKSSPEHLKQMEAVIECDRELSERLKEFPELSEAYEKFKDAIDEANCIDVRDHDIEGFSFGLLMGMDAESRS